MHRSVGRRAETTRRIAQRRTRRTCARLHLRARLTRPSSLCRCPNAPKRCNGAPKSRREWSGEPAEVLIRDSLTPAQVDPAGSCAVSADDWYSVYDAMTWTDPADVNIDHVVPVKDNGTSAPGRGPLSVAGPPPTTSKTHARYAPVTDNVNQSKGDALSASAGQRLTRE